MIGGICNLVDEGWGVNILFSQFYTFWYDITWMFLCAIALYEYCNGITGNFAVQKGLQTFQGFNNMVKKVQLQCLEGMFQPWNYSYTYYLPWS